MLHVHVHVMLHVDMVMIFSMDMDMTFSMNMYRDMQYGQWTLDMNHGHAHAA
jgi:hypothetical protein